MVRYSMWNRWRGRLSGVLTLAACGIGAACTSEDGSVRYDLTGAWFHSSGPAENARCFPTGLHWDDTLKLSWTVTRSNGDIVGTDNGGCSVPLEDHDGILTADGQACALASNGTLASLGVIERRFLRFRLDPSNSQFVATFVDRHEPNPTDQSIVCGFVEAEVVRRAP